MANGSANLAELPIELKEQVLSYLPDHLARPLGRLLLGRLWTPRGFCIVRSRIKAWSARYRAAAPPKNGTSPFLELPTELRAKIFKYLLPSKHESIAPTNVDKKREELKKWRAEADQRYRAVQLRAQAQAHAALNQQYHLHNVASTQVSLQHAAPLSAPVAQQPFPYNIVGHGIPHTAPTIALQPPAGVHGVNLAPIQTQGLQAPPAPLTAGFAMPFIHIPVPVPALPVPAAINFNVPAIGTGFTFPSFIQNGVAALNNLAHQIQHHATPATPARAVVVDDPEVDAGIQRQLHDAGYDLSKEHMAVTLLLVNKLVSSEIATILYEEYTFEVHVHANGVEFLNLPFIPTLETFGQKIDGARGAFTAIGQFCFQRMKHLEFVIFGGNPSDRTGGMRMRQSIHKLIEMVKEEKKPLNSLKIRFELEESPFSTQPGEPNKIIDHLGTFWRNKVDKRARFSISNEVTNIELVCDPFLELKGISRPSIKPPVGLESDEQTLAYIKTFMAKVGKTVESEDDFYTRQRMELQDQKVYDAAMDYDMQHSANPVEGYYKKLPPVAKERGIEGCIEDLLNGITQQLLEEHHYEKKTTNRARRTVLGQHAENDADMGDADSDMLDLDDGSDDEEENGGEDVESTTGTSKVPDLLYKLSFNDEEGAGNESDSLEYDSADESARKAELGIFEEVEYDEIDELEVEHGEMLGDLEMQMADSPAEVAHRKESTLSAFDELLK